MLAAAKEQILLVDDEPQVLIALEDLLSDQFRVLTASSAEAALNVMQAERRIAAVVTDQRMPRMNGDELLSRIGPVSDASGILVTGFADLTAVIRAVNEGHIFAYVTKPWDSEDLKFKVQQAVDRCRLARDLEAERKLLANLMESIPDGIYFKDRERKFVRANPAFADQVQIADVEHLIGRRNSELRIPALESRPTADDEARVLRDGVVITDHVFASRQGDVNRWYSDTMAPIRSAQGAITGLVAVSRDVTERIQIQETLRLNEGRLRDQTALLDSILNSMGEGVIVADSTGNFIVRNPRAIAILGNVDGDVNAHNWAQRYGLHLSDQITPLPLNLDPLLAAMGGEELAEMEVCVRNDHVRDAIIALTAAPLTDKAGRRAGGLMVLRDVTEKRSLQQLLTQSQKMDAIGRLAGGVAHDFNNLLVVIDSYGELLLRSLEKEDERRDDVDQIIGASKRAAGLTKQLLAFSRRQMIQPKVLDLNHIVGDLEKMLGRVIGEDIKLVTDLDPNVSAIRADSGQLEQIILNLTVNARDAMPEGGTITITTRDVYVDVGSEAIQRGLDIGAYVVLTVADTGTGMSPEIQSRIFEPFFTTKEPDRGTGLGLATVYGIVKQSDGHISVRSELRVGTTFLLHFPRVAHVADAEAAHIKSQRPATGTETVLLVEDNDAVRRVSARMLRDGGYRVLEARGAEDARAICAREGDHVDLMLTDVIMPTISGPKLASELTTIFPRMRVLYMSGYTADAVHGTDLAGHVFLEKPFSPTSLMEKVREVLSKD